MTEFVDNVQDVFRLLGSGPIDIKRMFGGHGLFRDGLMFGLVSDGIVYLKAGSAKKRYFDEFGRPPFEYVRKGKVAKLSYCHAMGESSSFFFYIRVRWDNKAIEPTLRKSLSENFMDSARHESPNSSCIMARQAARAEN